jgi:hypothetical protein
MKTKLLALALAISAAACTPTADEVSSKKAEPVQQQGETRQSWAMPSDGRFKLARVQDFQDNAAYNNYRSVYLLIDTETGKEFVGISGVGISELGSHRSGKTSATDER